MNKTNLTPLNPILRCRPGDEAHHLTQVSEMLKLRDPLGRNPKMLLQHVYTLVRPDELMAAEFIWVSLCGHYRISKENSERLRYVARVMSDYAIIEAHTHLHEPLFEREKQ